MTKPSLIILFCFLVIPGSDLFICKLRAPAGASIGVWPGSVVVLNCTILKDGPVEYFTWKKDGNILRNASLVSPVGPGKSLLMWEGLKLEDLSDKDNGQYSCVAVKGILSQEDWYTLRLFAKPNIITPRQSEVELRQGDRYTMTCIASGWPKPSITWTKDGNEYKEPSHIFKSSFGLTLHFLFARLADKGLYECHANSSIGSDVRPVLIKVKKVIDHVRKVTVTTPHHKITAYESQNISLECQALDVLKKMTAFFWKHNGLEYPENSYRFEGLNHVTFWYDIADVTLEDAGSYTCGVQTHEGTDSQIIWLNVEKQGPPRVSSDTPSIFSKLGNSATLSCTLKYSDITNAIIEWRRNNSQAFFNDSEHYITEHKDTSEGSIVFSLVIRNVTMEDLGCYNCDVNTSLGSNSSSLCLQLKGSNKGNDYEYMQAICN